MDFKHRLLAAATLGAAGAWASAASAGLVVFDVVLNNVIIDNNYAQVSSTPINIQFQQAFNVNLPVPTTSIYSSINGGGVLEATNYLYLPFVGESSSFDGTLAAEAGFTGLPMESGSLLLEEQRYVFQGASNYSNYIGFSNDLNQFSFTDDGTNYSLMINDVSETLGFQNGGQDSTYMGDQLTPLTVGTAGSYLSQYTYGVYIDASQYFDMGTDANGSTSSVESDAIYYGRATLDVAASDFLPEPGSWALMILGFGLAGVGLRRRRPVIA